MVNVKNYEEKIHEKNIVGTERQWELYKLFGILKMRNGKVIFKLRVDVHSCVKNTVYPINPLGVLLYII